MANEENKVVKSEPKPEKKKKKKNGLFSKIGKWFREQRSELKKVVWPTKKQVVNNTAVSLTVMCGSALVIWCFDQIASRGIQLIISIFH